MSSAERIIVLGCSGAGKSTFTRMAAKALDLPAVHLDQLFWQPGWVEGDLDAFTTEVAGIAQQEKWIVDGGYSITWPHTMPRAHAIVYLDLPRWKCMLGVIKRIFTTYGKVRPDSAPGCPERFDLEFLLYVWTWKKKVRPRMLRAIAERPPGCALYTVYRRRDMKKIVGALQVIDPFTPHR
ncbi:MAG: hypothetical protein ACPG1C_10800 [Alphaproteobacteria bacterium]